MKKGMLGLSLVVGLLGISACGNNEPDTQQQTVATTSQSVAESSVAKSSSSEKKMATYAESSGGATYTERNGEISFDEAVQMFQDKHKEVAITEIEWRKLSDGTGLYQIQGEDAKKEYEVKINAFGQMVGDIDHEDDDDNDWQEDQIDLQKVISLEEVFAVIEKHQANAEVTEADLKKDDGLTKWEVKGTVKDDKLSSEVEWTINAENGQLLDQETDDDTDDRDDDMDDDD